MDRLPTLDRAIELEADYGSLDHKDKDVARAETQSLVCPRAIDLFSGAGGFSLGAIRSGFEIRAAVENFNHAAATYRKQVQKPNRTRN